MKIESMGFLIFIIGVVFVIFSTYVKSDLIPYLAVAFLFVGALIIKYRKIIGGV